MREELSLTEQLLLFHQGEGAPMLPIYVLHKSVEVIPVNETEVSAEEVPPARNNGQSG